MSSPAPLVKLRAGIADAFATAIGGALIATKDAVGELTFTVTRDGLLAAARTLRDQFGYQQLMEIAGADYPERPERFEVNYHFLSLTENHRVRLKVLTDEETAVPSLTGLWPVAGWLEREVFDLYGVLFSGNADLRRILTDYGFEGHPLRKDFPMTGHVELRYSEADKRVVYEPVSLPQDFRTFDFLMPWEGAEYRLPGDEKAVGEAPGAPTPVPAGTAPGPTTSGKTTATTPKTTEATSQTGGGAPADAAEYSSARKPAASKARSAGGKRSATAEPKPGKKQ